MAKTRDIVVISGGVGAARLLRGLIDVVPGSSITAIVNVADDLELQAGDVLLELNGVVVRDPADVRDALSRSHGKVEIQLLRGGVKHNVSLERS